MAAEHHCPLFQLCETGRLPAVYQLFRHRYSVRGSLGEYGIAYFLAFLSSNVCRGDKKTASCRRIHRIAVIRDFRPDDSYANHKKESGPGDDPTDPEQDEAAVMPPLGSENPHESELERVAVKVGQKIHVILVPDILYIQSDGDYVQIVTDQHAYMKEETMKYFETSLPQSKFVRVHRSYIVNVEKILRIELYEKQSQMLTLKNGDKIRASVSGYKALRSVLNL